MRNRQAFMIPAAAISAMLILAGAAVFAGEAGAARFKVMSDRLGNALDTFLGKNKVAFALLDRRIAELGNAAEQQRTAKYIAQVRAERIEQNAAATQDAKLKEELLSLARQWREAEKRSSELCQSLTTLQRSSVQRLRLAREKQDLVDHTQAQVTRTRWLPTSAQSTAGTSEHDLDELLLTVEAELRAAVEQAAIVLAPR